MQENTKILTITPEMAAGWLRLNTGNRKLQPGHSASLAESIRAGRFILNGQPIIFSESGRCLDGQHRLDAVVKAGVPIRSFVVFGVRDDAFLTIDRGMRRTAGQIVGMAGHKNANHLASVLNMLIIEHTNRINQTWGFRAEPWLMEETLSLHPDLEDFLHIPLKLVRKFRVPGGSVGWAVYRMSQGSYEGSVAFVDAVENGAGLSLGSPELALRRRLEDNAHAKARLGTKEVTALLVKAWNAAYEGRPLSMLRYRSGATAREDSERSATEKFPVIAGAPPLPDLVGLVEGASALAKPRKTAA